jgi:Thiamine pyrophosphate enzyme, C-terminal TPP binding domain
MTGHIHPEALHTNSKATVNSTLILRSDGMDIRYEVNVKDIDNVTTAQMEQGKNLYV